MTTLAHAIPRFSHLRAHLRAYLVGVGATSALTAGAVVVFLSMATFVAFNGLPSFGSSSDDAGAAYLDSSTSAALTPAAALGAARSAVAKDPVPGAHRGSGPFGDRSGGGNSSGGSSSRGSSSGGGSTDPGGGGPINPSGPGAIPPSGSAPSIPTAPAPPTDVPSAPSLPSIPSVPDAPGGINPPPIDAPSAPSLPSTPSLPNVPNLPSTSGPVAGAVQGVDNAAGTSLSGPTSGVTSAVDAAASGALN